MNANPSVKRIGLLGYGEVGKIFGSGLLARGFTVRAWDILLDDGKAAEAMRAHADAAGVALAQNAEDLAASSELIISAVTAAEALNAARSVAAALPAGIFYFDINSVSPDTRVRCAEVVDGAGGRYVEAAVMSAVPPYGLAAPMLLGGRWARDFMSLAPALGLEARAISERIGVPSATKLCRSVIVKGLEALFIEGFTAARAYGVERDVIDYLKRTFPGFDFEQQATYFFERVITHGRRRAEEMREAADTVRAIGLDPLLASATADRQAAVAARAQENPPSDRGTWTASADWLLAATRGS